MASTILTVNGGSSSIKFALYAPATPPARLLSAQIDRIGLADATFMATDDSIVAGKPERRTIAAADHGQAVGELIDWLAARGDWESLGAVGHRVVHGGGRFTDPTIITPEVIEALRGLNPLSPMHMPGELASIEAICARRPDLPQVACFDTAFHHDLPRLARLLPLPRRYEAAGVRRYGFHGLSYAYLMEALEAIAGRDAAQGRLILAHLGNGASLAAVNKGKPVDTTMCFTPAAGLVMGTRTGDLDPGLLAYLMRQDGLNGEAIDELVNRRSGLLGISETSSDMRDLLARQASDPRAADAVAIFCYQAKKWLGAYTAALGGLDTLVFAGGIGENSGEVRARICEGLKYLGIRLSESSNRVSADVISEPGSAVSVRVIRTDEDLMIAKEVLRLISISAN